MPHARHKTVDRIIFRSQNTDKFGQKVFLPERTLKLGNSAFFFSSLAYSVLAKASKTWLAVYIVSQKIKIVTDSLNRMNTSTAISAQPRNFFWCGKLQRSIVICACNIVCDPCLRFEKKSKILKWPGILQSLHCSFQLFLRTVQHRLVRLRFFETIAVTRKCSTV